MNDPAWVGAFARYQRAMVEAAQAHILPLADDVMTRASQSIGELLSGVASSDPIMPKALRRDEVVFQKLFYGFVEIAEAFDMLRDAEVYIRSLPRKRLIPPHRFMRYHITNFYNNAYVLSQRLQRYASIIERSYRNASHVTGIQDIVLESQQIATSGMKPITVARGAYIHQNHFTDDHFERLSVTDLLTARGETETDDQFVQSMSLLHEVSIKKARREWLNKIVSQNNYMSNLLDAYFHLIHRIIFDGDNHIVYPHSPRATSG